MLCLTLLCPGETWQTQSMMDCLCYCAEHHDFLAQIQGCAVEVWSAHLAFQIMLSASQDGLIAWRSILCMVESEADRLCSAQTGMRGAFGKPQGTCARVAIGQILLSIRCKDVHSPQSQEALRRAKFKFAGRQKIVVSRNWCAPCAHHQPGACFLHISCKLRQCLQGICRSSHWLSSVT